MTAETIELPAFRGRPRRGRHARPRRGLGPMQVIVAVVAAAAAAVVFLTLSGHPQLPRAAPSCVAWSSCRCRYPGSPLHLNGNQLCPLQHESAARIVLGKARP